MAKKRPPKTDEDEPAPRRRAGGARSLRKLDREIVELLNERAAARAAARGEATASRRRYDRPGGRRCGGRSRATARCPPAPSTPSFASCSAAFAPRRQPLRVAYLGPEYTYSHLAAIARFGQSAELMPVASIAAVFEEVERGHAEYGVVPIENSTDGRVADALECFGRLGRSDAGAAASRDVPASAAVDVANLRRGAAADSPLPAGPRAARRRSAACAASRRRCRSAATG